MSHIISEILLITVPVEPGFKLDSLAFAKLRDKVVEGGVKEQYLGISMNEPDKLVWVIRAFDVLSSLVNKPTCGSFDIVAWRYKPGGV